MNSTNSDTGGPNEAVNRSSPIPVPRSEERPDQESQISDLDVECCSDDELSSNESEKLSSNSDSEEPTEQQMVDQLRSPEVSNEPTGNLVQPFRNFSEDHQIQDQMNNPLPFRLPLANPDICDEIIAQIFPATSTFKFTKFGVSIHPHFAQVLGHGYSKSNDIRICQRVLQVFRMYPIHHVFVLETNIWTPQKAFIALKNVGIKIFLVAFFDHPMIELIKEVGNTAKHFNIVFFKDFKVIKNIRIH